MQLDEVNTHALGLFFEHNAKTVLYNEKEILAHIKTAGFSTGRWAKRQYLVVRRSDVPIPESRDEIEIDGVAWEVYFDRNQGDIVISDDITHTIPITSDTRPGYSRK